MKKLTCMLTMIMMILGMSFVCHAEELKENVLYQLQKDTGVYESADESSEVIAELSAGTGVICMSSDTEWTQIQYQDIQGYVPTAFLKMYGDQEALAAEFSEVQQENDLRYERMEEYIQQQKDARLWGSIIVILVIAIFGVGIFSAIKKNKQQGMEHADTK